MAKKFVIFISNLNYIIESNARRSSPSSHILGLNKFSDWSMEEFKETYLNPQQMLTDMSTDNAIETNDLPHIAVPSSLDWRTEGTVTVVKNQGSPRTCWAFSAVGAIEGINAIVTGNLISLSVQELVDCANASGKVSTSFNWVIKNGGIASDAAYPYKTQQGACKSSEVANIASITGYGKVGQSDAALLSATAIQPISVKVNATDMQHYTKDSGIFDGGNCKNTTYVDHSILIVWNKCLGL